MGKFKKGDRVRLMKYDEDEREADMKAAKIGDILTLKDETNPYDVEENNQCWDEDQLELVTDELQVGDKVLILWDKTGYIKDSNYKNIGVIKYRRASGRWGVGGFYKAYKNYSLGFETNQLEKLDNGAEVKEVHWSEYCTEPDKHILSEPLPRFYGLAWGTWEVEKDDTLIINKKPKGGIMGRFLKKLTTLIKTFPQPTRDYYQLGWVEIQDNDLVVTEEGETAYIQEMMIGGGDLPKLAAKQVKEIKAEEKNR